MCPLDLHHLMDAFRITAELSSAHLREIAVQQLGLLEEEVTADCQVSMAFFWLVAAWVKSRAERPSVSVVNRQLHVQIGCKLGIRNRKDELEASKAKQITN